MNIALHRAQQNSAGGVAAHAVFQNRLQAVLPAA